LAEYDLYWLIVTLTGRICSQSKVLCRSALLCRFNIPISGNPSRRIGLKQSFESFENIQFFSFAGLWVAVWVAAIASATATGVCVRTDTDSRIQLDAGGGSMSLPGQQSCCLIVLAGRPVQYLCSRRAWRPGGRCAGASRAAHKGLLLGGGWATPYVASPVTALRSLTAQWQTAGSASW